MATPALTDHVFKAPLPMEQAYNMSNVASKALFADASKAYNNAADLVGSYMGMYGLSSMAFALILTLYAAKRDINRKYIHMISLLAGGIGFISMYFIRDPEYLIYSFILIGISWGSILSMPYAMLSSAIHAKKMGMYMGIFNMFIVIPQIIAATGGLNFLYHLIFGKEAINAMLLAGTSLIIGGLANFLITDPKVIKHVSTDL
ncbi:MFS transporter [Pedobacter panaciterrae]